MAVSNRSASAARRFLFDEHARGLKILLDAYLAEIDGVLSEDEAYETQEASPFTGSS